MSDVKTCFDPDWAKKDIGIALKRLQRYRFDCHLQYDGDFWVCDFSQGWRSEGCSGTLEECAIFINECSLHIKMEYIEALPSEEN